jgi:DNA-binding GntR family transcriptional regulator
VADVIRERIIEGELRGGEALRESSIAVGLQVSRNSVREGFRLLARQGLVVHEQHRGVRVRRLTTADVADIYRVRRTVELLGLASVDPADLRRILLRARTAADAGDWQSVSTADLRFHQQIVAASGSPRLDAMFVDLLAELRLAFAAFSDLRGFHEPYLERNAVLVDLLERGDLPAAEAELTDYLDRAENEISAMLRMRDSA